MESEAPPTGSGLAGSGVREDLRFSRFRGGFGGGVASFREHIRMQISIKHTVIWRGERERERERETV